jgi:hypothetical protein
VTTNLDGEGSAAERASNPAICQAWSKYTIPGKKIASPVHSVSFECTRAARSSKREAIQSSSVTACLRSKGHAIKSLIVRTEVALSHAVVGEDLHAMNRSFTDRLVVGCGEHAAGCKNLRRMTELLALPIADRNCVDGMRRKMWSSKRRVDCFDVDWVRGTV